MELRISNGFEKEVQNFILTFISMFNLNMWVHINVQLKLNIVQDHPDKITAMYTNYEIWIISSIKFLANT